MSNVSCQQVSVGGDSDGFKHACCMWCNDCSTEEGNKSCCMSYQNTVLVYLSTTFTEFFILIIISALNH
jgi:hypothetical protein